LIPEHEVGIFSKVV
jgi:hypothetical protein